MSKPETIHDTEMRWRAANIQISQSSHRPTMPCEFPAIYCGAIAIRAPIFCDFWIIDHVPTGWKLADIHAWQSPELATIKKVAEALSAIDGINSTNPRDFMDAAHTILVEHDVYQAADTPPEGPWPDIPRLNTHILKAPAP